MYKETDVDAAYEAFLNTFKALYDKNCPIIEQIWKQEHRGSLWITKGLQNACKKKNTLYRQLIKYRTIEAERKYKMYKNKLTNIRTCKKDYYTIQIENNKNNIKGIWNVLYSIIQKISSNAINAEYFVDEVININNMEDVVNGFNNYFVNIGPKLAEKKSKTDTNTEGEEDDYGDGNPNSIFLSAVSEKVIIDIVHKCKCKKKLLTGMK